MPNADDLIEQLTKELDFYFANADPNRHDHNANLIMPLLNKWGVRAISVGFVWILGDLQEQFRMIMAKKTRTPTSEIKIIVRNRAIHDMALIYDMVSFLGEQAGEFLNTIISSAPSEDMQSLATYTLVAPAFFRPVYCSTLQQAYFRAEGTACRMVLAFALSQCNELSYIRTFIDAGYFCSKDEYQRLEWKFRQDLPNQSPLEREKTLVTMVVAPEMTGVPDLLKQDQLGLIGCLAMDIASAEFVDDSQQSSGLVFKRKRY